MDGLVGLRIFVVYEVIYTLVVVVDSGNQPFF